MSVGDFADGACISGVELWKGEDNFLRCGGTFSLFTPVNKVVPICPLALSSREFTSFSKISIFLAIVGSLLASSISSLEVNSLSDKLLDIVESLRSLETDEPLEVWGSVSSDFSSIDDVSNLILFEGESI